MATKFASVYKQELKNKGVLSSMGSAVLKSAKERMDVRNIFFGGKGMLSATGQKIFGRGYSPLSSDAISTPSNSQMAAQSAATGELISSNERQEALLRVVAKNTFNMNMMARDTNITRQNIATMTRVMSGKAAQSQDALWYDVKTRNQSIDSLGKKQNTPTKANETKPSGGGIFSGITSVIGSVVGALGGIGGGILSALSIVARLSPILGIISVIASAYVIKELGKAVDFGAIGEAIAKFLGIDTKSEKGFFQQILENLDKKFETTFFTDTKKQIEGFYERASNLIIKNFGPQINAVGKGVAVAVDIATVYTRAAFQTLADGFSGIGKAIGFLFNEFFQSNKGSIFAAITAGLAIGYGGKNAASALTGLGAASLAGLFGKATGEQSREERKAELDKLTKEYAGQMEIIKAKEAEEMRKYGKTGGKEVQLMREGARKLLAEIVEKQAMLDAKEAEFREFFTPDPNRFNQYLQEGRASLPGGQYGGGYRPLISDERMAQAGAQPGTASQSGAQPPGTTTPVTPGTASQSGAQPPGTAPTRIPRMNDLIHGRYRVSSEYGDRVSPIDGKTREFHKGVDIALRPNHPLTATVDGEVIAVGNNVPSGNFVSIKDADGNVYSYSHLNSSKVIKGQKVKRGDLIGLSGNTGRSTGPHLHFGVKDKQGNYRSPTEEEVKNAISISEKISALSIENMDQRMALMSPDAGGGTTVNTTNNNYSAGRGDSQAFAGVIDAEAMYLFAG